MKRRGPNFYRTMEEFEREEIQPYRKCGWSLDDLYQEATFQPAEDSSLEEPKELDFDY